MQIFDTPSKTLHVFANTVVLFLPAIENQLWAKSDFLLRKKIVFITPPPAPSLHQAVAMAVTMVMTVPSDSQGGRGMN